MSQAEINHALLNELDRAAQARKLLVACDYDGTLAPIVADPMNARPARESIVALRMLASLDDTEVAVISGRSLTDLAELTGLPGSVHLVGSHGSEFDPGFADSLTGEQRQLLRNVRRELGDIAGTAPGFVLENKPASVAFHYRNAARAEAERAVREVTQGPAATPGVFTKRGKLVIELSVVGQHKGDALVKIRQRVDAEMVVFIGDDVTDEDAFATLRGPDIGVKVGPGESGARFRVDDTRGVSRLLARLAEHRAAWQAGESLVGIEQHSMLSDQRVMALVTPSARVTWLCVPRVDSPAIFAELVGGPSAGFFSVARADGAGPTGQRYVPGTMVLETDFGGFKVADFLDCSAGRTSQRAGRSDLFRIIEGAGRVRIEFAPRLDYGRTATRLSLRDGGLDVLDSPEPIVLHSPGLPWSIRDHGKHQTAVCEVDLTDEPLVLTLRCGAGTLRALARTSLDHRRLTGAYWSDWARELQLPDVEPEAVMRSALVLRGLVYRPTGAVVAAATTSLPETLGGVRNWDYRFCWLRDAAIAAQALIKLNSEAEAMQLLDWFLGVVERAPSPDRIHPLYAVTGEELSAEAEIGDLRGYGGSRPVRIGNAAARQVQLDVFGPIVELVYLLAERDAPLTPRHWRFVEALVGAVDKRWRDADHGIWEIRLETRHWTHSRAACWQTVDRAIKAANLLRDRAPPEWSKLRDEIRADVLECGWNQKLGAFSASYEQADLDAATLCIGLIGLVPPDDERFVATVEAIERELMDGASVYRYRYDDGLPGAEGAFHLCTCWMVMSYILMGRLEDAEKLFGAFVRQAGVTGLLSEEWGVNTSRGLGNHPQAYSHAGLIECAVMLDRARRERNGGVER